MNSKVMWDHIPAPFGEDARRFIEQLVEKLKEDEEESGFAEETVFLVACCCYLHGLNAGLHHDR